MRRTSTYAVNLVYEDVQKGDVDSIYNLFVAMVQGVGLQLKQGLYREQGASGRLFEAKLIWRIALLVAYKLLYDLMSFRKTPIFNQILKSAGPCCRSKERDVSSVHQQGCA